MPPPVGMHTELPLSTIRLSPLCPRDPYDQDAFVHLVESIKANGILEPLVVRGHTAPWECVHGAGRLAAAREVGLTHVPARVFPDLSDRDALEVRYIETVRQEELNPIERALGFRSLLGLGYTQCSLAQHLGMSQPLVSNTVRLLELPPPVQEHIRAGRLSASHGNVLLLLRRDPDAMCEWAEQAVREKWPTQELRDRVDQLVVTRPRRPQRRPSTGTDRAPRVPAPLLDDLWVALAAAQDRGSELARRIQGPNLEASLRRLVAVLEAE